MPEELDHIVRRRCPQATSREETVVVQRLDLRFHQQAVHVPQVDERAVLGREKLGAACETKPQRMPWVIENVSGMRMIVRNAGSRSSSRSRVSRATLRNMKQPTMISTGAVAQAGTTSASGATKRQGRKQSAVKTEVSPVRPPISIPAELSM